MIEYAIFENVSGAIFELNGDKTPVKSFNMHVDSRREQLDKVNDHGSWESYQYSGERQFHFVGDLLGDDSGDFMQLYMALQGAFITAPYLGHRKVGVLRIRFTGIDSELTSNCYVDGHPSVPIEALSPMAAEYMVDLIANDPALYFATQYTFEVAAPNQAGGVILDGIELTNVVFAGTGLNNSEVYNPGNMEVKPSFRIWGPTVSPSIRIDSGDYVRSFYLGKAVLTDGEWLDVNMRERTIIRNGSVNAYNLFDPRNSTWFDVPPGYSTIIYSAFDAAPPSRVEFSINPAIMM